MNKNLAPINIGGVDYLFDIDQAKDEKQKLDLAKEDVILFMKENHLDKLDVSLHVSGDLLQQLGGPCELVLSPQSTTGRGGGGRVRGISISASMKSPS